MTIDNLKSDIKSNQIKNLMLFFGPEEYLKNYYLETIKKKLLVDNDLNDLNTIILKDKVTSEKIIDTCNTRPFFSEKKIVIVKNSTLFKANKKNEDDKKSKSTKKDELSNLLEHFPQDICLIFIEEEIDKRIKYSKIIEKNGRVVEFPYQNANNLVKWAIKVFNSNGKQIDQITASKFIDIAEESMLELLNEINKIILFLGERKEVTFEDIEKVCTKSIKSRIFDLIDAISQREGEKAIKLLNEMLILKEPIPKIIFLIARQLRILLQVKFLLDKGISPKEIAKKIGLHPYVSEKVARQTKSFSIDKLKKSIKESCEFDLGIKTGKISDITALEILIANLTTK